MKYPTIAIKRWNIFVLNIFLIGNELMLAIIKAISKNTVCVFIGMYVYMFICVLLCLQLLMITIW